MAPTFSAYEIAASFLLPFVAIRAVAGDRISGALKLELQQSMAPLSMIATKVLVLGAGWLLAGREPHGTGRPRKLYRLTDRNAVYHTVEAGR